jgi:hypothetical protein
MYTLYTRVNSTERSRGMFDSPDMRKLVVLLIAACDSGAVAPPKLGPPPTPPPADAAPAPPVMTIATWSSTSRPDALPSPACIHANDRMIQYADLDADHDARFCIWFHLDRGGFPDVGCWRVDLTADTYHPETGVWFSSPQPPHEDDGSTSATLANGTSARLLGSRLQVGKSNLTLPGKGGIVLARKSDFVVVDRDGRVLVVDAAAKITHTITPHGPCTIVP